MPCASSCRLWLTFPWIGSDLSIKLIADLPDYIASLNHRSSQLQQRPAKLTTHTRLARGNAPNGLGARFPFECIAHSRGAYFSNFGSLGSIASHDCASEVQILCCGLYKLGSSKVPAAIPCPKSDLPPNNREPHSGQKPRRLSPIVSLLVPKYFGVPLVILNAFAGT